MADYATLQEARDSDRNTNMTYVRNGVKNDDGVDKIVASLDWFKYNSRSVSDIFVSGNMWTGLGLSTEHLKINRRDTSVLWIAYETGYINTTQFYKIFVSGYSTYNGSSESQRIRYCVYLLDTGQIFLDYITVPTSSFTTVNALTCGTEVLTIPVTSGVPMHYTFTPSDPTTGTGWTGAEELPVFIVDYVPEGTANYSIDIREGLITGSSIVWSEDVPLDTTLDVLTSLDGSIFNPVTNGGSALPNGSQSSGHMYIKIEMYTSNINKTPTIQDISILLTFVDDANSIVISVSELERFESAVGPITVIYSGGSLSGEGGPVEPFEVSFTPIGLIAKPDQMHAENISITNVTASGILKKIAFSDVTLDAENMAIANVTAVGTLTNISDI